MESLQEFENLFQHMRVNLVFLDLLCGFQVGLKSQEM